jgi:hypothetical protein
VHLLLVILLTKKKTQKDESASLCSEFSLAKAMSLIKKRSNKVKTFKQDKVVLKK